MMVTWTPDGFHDGQGGPVDYGAVILENLGWFKALRGPHDQYKKLVYVWRVLCNRETRTAVARRAGISSVAPIVDKFLVQCCGMPPRERDTVVPWEDGDTAEMYIARRRALASPSINFVAVGDSLNAMVPSMAMPSCPAPSLLKLSARPAAPKTRKRGTPPPSLTLREALAMAQERIVAGAAWAPPVFHLPDAPVVIKRRPSWMIGVDLAVFKPATDAWWFA